MAEFGTSCKTEPETGCLTLGVRSRTLCPKSLKVLKGLPTKSQKQQTCLCCCLLDLTRCAMDITRRPLLHTLSMFEDFEGLVCGATHVCRSEEEVNFHWRRHHKCGKEEKQVIASTFPLVLD